MWYTALILLYPAEIDQAIKDEKAGQYKSELLRICKRESNCKNQKVHPLDGRLGKTFFDAAIKKKLLDVTCNYSQLNLEQWAPGGLYGMSPAYHLWRIKDHTGPCAKPETLHDPYLATVAAIRYMRRNKKKSCYDRLVKWAGPGIWKQRSVTHKLRSVYRTCGAKGLLTYMFNY